MDAGGLLLADCRALELNGAQSQVGSPSRLMSDLRARRHSTRLKCAVLDWVYPQPRHEGSHLKVISHVEMHGLVAVANGTRAALRPPSLLILRALGAFTGRAAGRFC